MNITYLPVLVAALGAGLYGFSANPKAVELGRISFAFGLLVTLLVFCHVR